MVWEISHGTNGLGFEFKFVARRRWNLLYEFGL